MKKEKQEILFKEFPELFVRSGLSKFESCMARGLEIGDGWYNIIYDLCSEITEYCKENDKPIPAFEQVKEKFGGLTVYMNDYTLVDDFCSQCLSKAAKRSYQTCEVTGKDGRLYRCGGWLRVICDEIAEENNCIRMGKNEN